MTVYEPVLIMCLSDMNYDCVQTSLNHVLILTVITFLLFFLDDDSFTLLHWSAFTQLLLGFSQKFLNHRVV